jgi:hypothetical protein
MEFSPWETIRFLANSEIFRISGKRSFVTMFRRAFHWALCWVRRIKFASLHPVSPRSTLMLSSHLRLGHPSDFLVFLPKACVNPSSMRASCPAHHILRDFIMLITYWWGAEVMKFLIVNFSLASLVHIFSSAPLSQISSIYVLPLMWETNVHTDTKPHAKLRLHIF